MDRIDVIYEMKDDNLNLPKYIEFSSLKQKKKWNYRKIIIQRKDIYKKVDKRNWQKKFI